MKKYRVYLSDGKLVDIEAETIRFGTSLILGATLELLNGGKAPVAVFGHKVVIGYAELDSIISPENKP